MFGQIRFLTRAALVENTAGLCEHDVYDDKVFGSAVFDQI